MSNSYGSTWKNKDGKTHYELNKSYYKEKVYLKRLRIRKFILRIKKRFPCYDCGINYPFYVKDFDHLENKSILISKIHLSGWSMKRIKEELRKCQLVCANCHRIRTFSRFESY